MEEQSAFANRLKELMETRGISLSELSRRSGIHKSAISRYQNGAYEAAGKNLIQLSETLGVSVDYLLGKEQAMQNDDSSDDEESEERTKPMNCRYCGAAVIGKYCPECGTKTPLGDKFAFEEMKKVRKLFIEGECTEQVIRRAAWEIAQSEFENGRSGKEPNFIPLKLSAEFCPDGIGYQISKRAESLCRVINNFLQSKSP